jgi:PBP1b-binding outer membrane lipoprotein LpoB
MRILSIILILFFLSACEKKQVKEISFEDEVKKRFELFLNKEESNCRKDAEAAADKYIDSVIDGWIKKELIDTIDFPQKPTRPKHPGKIIE